MHHLGKFISEEDMITVSGSLTAKKLNIQNYFHSMF